MTFDLFSLLPHFQSVLSVKKKIKTAATQEKSPIDSFKELSGNYPYLTLMLLSLQQLLGDVIYYSALTSFGYG